MNTIDNIIDSGGSPSQSKRINALIQKKIILVLLNLLFIFPQWVQADSSEPPLQIAMTAAFVSESGIHVYDNIAQYLSKKIHRPISFVTGLSYSTVNSMIDENVVDMAF